MKPIKLNENTGIFDMEARLLMERVDAGKLLQKKKNYAIYNIEHGA
jgi:hypothetical protein